MDDFVALTFRDQLSSKPDDLLRRADIALGAGCRDQCTMLIARLYELLDEQVSEDVKLATTAG